MHGLQLHLTFYYMHGMVSLSVSMIFMPHISSSMQCTIVSATSSLLPFWVIAFIHWKVTFCFIFLLLSFLLLLWWMKLHTKIFKHIWNKAFMFINVYLSCMIGIFSCHAIFFFSSFETKPWLIIKSERKLMISLFIASATKSLLLLPMIIGLATTVGLIVLSALCWLSASVSCFSLSNCLISHLLFELDFHTCYCLHCHLLPLACVLFHSKVILGLVYLYLVCLTLLDHHLALQKTLHFFFFF